MPEKSAPPASRFLLCQKARENRGGLSHFACFALDLLSPCSRQPIVFGAAIVIGDAPSGGDVAFLLQFEQRGIKRPVVKRQKIPTGLLDAPRDAVAVQ